MSENKKAETAAYIGTRKITSSAKWLLLCVLLSLLAAVTLMNAFPAEGEAFGAAAVTHLATGVVYAAAAVFAWLTYAGADAGLTGLKICCLAAAVISIAYTAVAAIFLAYILIDNSIAGWGTFGLRILFTVFTFLTSLVQSMYLLKACRLLTLMRRAGQVANEAPLRLNAILAAVTGLVIIVIGVLGLQEGFFGSTAITPAADISGFISGLKLPVSYTGFVRYRGSVTELIQTVLTVAVLFCGGMCI